MTGASRGASVHRWSSREGEGGPGPDDWRVPSSGTPEGTLWSGVLSSDTRLTAERVRLRCASRVVAAPKRAAGIGVTPVTGPPLRGRGGPRDIGGRPPCGRGAGEA
ncbi:hypothetical protein GCM10010392_52670 [Streptomyces clavifer]|nr:hypothetical protein GCM10010392_52670 [Streptomyces clavifer]